VPTIGLGLVRRVPHERLELSHRGDRLSGALKRWCSDRRYWLEVAAHKVEESLTCVRVPLFAAVLSHHLPPPRRKADRADGTRAGELLAEVAQRSANSLCGDAGVGEPFGGPKKHQILEREPIFTALPPLRRQESLVHQRPHAPKRHVEHR